MIVVQVFIHVKPGQEEAFRAATLDNVLHSLREPGIARFDFLQDSEDPSRFMLIEAFRDPADIEAHRQTAHYARWREAAEDMMAEPRTSRRYINLHPTDALWPVVDTSQL